MKKISLLLIALVVLFSVACAKKPTGETLKKVKEQGYFILGLDDSFPPMGFKNKKGKIVGFDIDLAKEVAKRMGVKLRLKPVKWSGVILSLKKGDIDLIWNGMTITESRQKQINFSDVYLKNRQVLIVKKDSSVNTKGDLKDKVIGHQMGSSSEEALKNDESLSSSVKDVKKYSDNIKALLDLKAGRIEAVVVDEIVGRYYMSKKPGVYRVLKEDLGSEAYGIGFRKEDGKFLEAVNNILEEMKKDGTAAKISQKWFTEDIMEK